MMMYKDKKYECTVASYLAGCVDCDGSISIIDRKLKSSESKQIRVTVCGANKEYIEKIGELTGYPYIYLSKRAGVGLHKKDLYQWHISKHSQCFNFLSQILPYLLLKDNKAKSALKISEMYLEHK